MLGRGCRDHDHDLLDHPGEDEVEEGGAAGEEVEEGGAASEEVEEGGAEVLV